VIDYAVRMVQFDQHRLLSNLQACELNSQVIDGLADRCARFHSHAATAPPGSEVGTPDQVRKPILENFGFLCKVDESMQGLVANLKEQTLLKFSKLREACDSRRSNGMMRERHGDLHLGNMFLDDDEVTIFDGIEFNEEFRWIDIVNDIAFAIMDFEDRGLCCQSKRFLNRWLERTGDYDGLNVLAFYGSY